MSRTAQANVQALESRVLSTDADTHIELDAPPPEATALVEAADIEVIATEGTEDAGEGEPVLDAADLLAITCDADFRVTWGELDEWLGRS